MSKIDSVSIIGATGVVGRELIALIGERSIQLPSVTLHASTDSVGEMYSVAGEEVEVKELNNQVFKPGHLAFFAGSKDVHAQFIPAALERGAVVVDLAGRGGEDLPGRTICSPVTIQSSSAALRYAVVAHPLASTLSELISVAADIQPVKRVTASTYQCVAGAGKGGLDELWSQTLGIFNQQMQDPGVFRHQIAFNCIPVIDLVSEDGSTREERRIAEELKLLLKMPQLRVAIQAVRVPVFHSDGMSIGIEFDGPVTIEALVERLNPSSGFSVSAQPDEYPMPLDTVGSDEIRIGRLRRDDSVEHGVLLWLTVDSVRRGLAHTAVQVFQKLQSNG